MCALVRVRRFNTQVHTSFREIPTALGQAVCKVKELSAGTIQDIASSKGPSMRITIRSTG